MKKIIGSALLLMALTLGMASSSTSSAASAIDMTTAVNSTAVEPTQTRTSSNSDTNVDWKYALLAPIVAVAAVCLIEYVKYRIEYTGRDDNAAEQKIMRKLRQQEKSDDYGEPRNFNEQITSQIRKSDINFSTNKFIWLAENIFIAYMNAYSERDISLLEMLTTEDIFFTDKENIEKQLQNGTAYKRLRISFHTDYMYKYEYNDRFEYVTLYIKANMIDYLEDTNTGGSLKGSKNTDVFTFYSLTLRRKLGEKTVVTKGTQATACPKCGAPLDAVIACRCPYCGMAVKTLETGWYISAVYKTNLGPELKRAGIFRIS